ncbi:putative hydrogenase nickel incorporation protein HypA [Ktedonobacter sp. SOSP1-52]|uniref:hydrogenase maturation nickel metallochaperone HypA n=1 Tax=Ktedonobacter sp. SOSP1-52 TaxID=2778366 RepID=UPI001915A14D|nr:hydrogenase maturation nickel metallochaperone HypA [Ktedonobacter sp. SOSP1-52]GHO67747.1 putative hydrogenase nickel incorporation protein HypA [Ktedonobacter sp. SOSP1-52]
MHELAIAQGIAEAVDAQAQKHQATHVREIHLQIGEAQGVVNDSLTFCFEMVASLYPLLEGSRLSIEFIPYRARCQHCASEFTVINFIRQCPACQGWETEVISGTEMQIDNIEIDAPMQAEE